MKETSPIVYNELAKTHSPANSDVVISPKHIKVAEDSKNLLKNSAAGLSVTVADIVSEDAGNKLREGADGRLYGAATEASELISARDDNQITLGADDKLYVAPPTGEEVLSQEKGNLLRFGNDKGVLVRGQDLLSNNGENHIVVDPTDGRLTYTPDYEDVVSKTRDNALSVGEDGRVFLSKADLCHCQMEVPDSVTVVSKDYGNMIQPGRDSGAYLSELTVEGLVQDYMRLQPVKHVSAEPDNLIEAGRDDLAYLSPESVADSVDSALDSGSVNVVSDDEGNMVTARDGGRAYLDPSVVDARIDNKLSNYDLDVKVVSDDPKNVLTEGSDEGAYLAEDAFHRMFTIVSRDMDNLLSDGDDGGAYLSKASVLGTLTVVSKDAGNLVIAGSDNGAFFDRNSISTYVKATITAGNSGVTSGDRGNLLEEGIDGGAKLTHDTVVEEMKKATENGEYPLVSKDEENLIVEGADKGAYLSGDTIINQVTQAVKDGKVKVVSEDPGNIVVEGSDKLAYLKLDTLVATSGDEGDNALKVDEAGKLYVPDKWLPTTGGEITGSLTVGEEPQSDNDVATKKYVDSVMAKAAGIPVGQWMLWPYKDPPAGFLTADGSQQRRDTYIELWEYLSAHQEMVLTEQAWQEKAAASNGYCNQFSDGDGQTYFRLPKFAPFIQLTTELSTGAYHEAGLPNIIGTTSFNDYNGTAGFAFHVDAEQTSGAFIQAEPLVTPIKGLQSTGAGSETKILGIDASSSSSPGAEVYGRAETVQPESMEWHVVISAFAKIDESEGVSIKDLKDALQEYRSSVEAILPLGHIYSWPYKELPPGTLALTGEEYSRDVYRELWEFVNEHPSWIKTEAEWQDIASQSNGYCPYYSSGDGVVTFRVPKFAPFQMHGSVTHAAEYKEAGVPIPDLMFRVDSLNPEVGTTHIPVASMHETERYGMDDYGGSIAHESNGSDEPMVDNGMLDDNAKFGVVVERGVYGASDTVTPESNTWVYCVVAFSNSTTNKVDVDSLKEVLTRVENTQLKAYSSYNTVKIITESQEDFVPPAEGWYRVTIVGGGGGGAGGNEDPHTATGGGGGGSGGVIVAYLYLYRDLTYNKAKYTITIGAGGEGGVYKAYGSKGGATIFSCGCSPDLVGQAMAFNLAAGGGLGGGGVLLDSDPDGITGCAPSIWSSFTGGRGGENTIICAPDDAVLSFGGVPGGSGQANSNYGQPQNAVGGCGGSFGGGAYGVGVECAAYAGSMTLNNSNGKMLPFGAGGGGGLGSNTSDTYRQPGGAGANGCVILEYYDPNKSVRNVCVNGDEPPVIV